MRRVRIPEPAEVKDKMHVRNLSKRKGEKNAAGSKHNLITDDAIPMAQKFLWYLKKSGRINLSKNKNSFKPTCYRAVIESGPTRQTAIFFLLG